MAHLLDGLQLVFLRSGGRMAWNTFLALAPLVLALALFTAPARRLPRPVRWVGVAAFVALLPNAPYTATDVLHLAGDVRAVGSDHVVALVVAPVYGAFVMIGLGSYLASLALVAGDLERRGRHALVVPAMAAIHVVTAIGIWLGRIDRLNSWDALHRPGVVLERIGHAVTTGESLVVIVGLAVVLAAGHAIAIVAADAVGWIRRGGAPTSLVPYRRSMIVPVPSPPPQHIVTRP